MDDIEMCDYLRRPVPKPLSKAQRKARGDFRGVMMKRKIAIREFIDAHGPEFTYPADFCYETDGGPGELHPLAGTRATFLHFTLCGGTWQVWVQTVKGKKNYGVYRFLVQILQQPDPVEPKPKWNYPYRGKETKHGHDE